MSVEYALLLIYLGKETATDIRRKEISVAHWLLIACVLFVSCIWIEGFEVVVGGMVPGILLMAFSKISDESVGYGDGMVLMVCGMVLGIEKVGALFLLALLILMPVALWKLVIRKSGGKEEIAFLPYLLTAYLILLYLT